jgi:TonB family protein
MATQASDTANNTAGKRTRGASPDDLSVIAQRAQAFTNASGVAIALSEGNADEIVCRARSGNSAPDVGAVLRVEGTFTGLCIQSGKELRCDDCETDTRVDTTAIRALNIRSMVVTPIKEENRVVGVLAVFAPTPHAFTITHVAVLKTMADQISGLLQRERRARDEGQHVDAIRPLAPVPVAKPAVAPPAPVATPPVVIKPASAAAAAPARAASPAISKPEPVKAPMPLEVVPLAVPPTPKKEERRTETSPRANFGTFDSVAAEEKKPGNKFMMLGVAAVLVIAAAATFAFLKMNKPASAQHTQEASSATSAPAPSSSTQPLSSSSTAANPAAPVVSASAGGSSASAKSVSEPENKKAAAKNEKNDRNSAAEKPSPAAEKPVTVATLSNGGPSRIAANNDSSAPEVAPSFNVSSGGNMPAPLTALARPVATSTPTAALEQSQLEPLQLLKTVPAYYPPIARARRMGGSVVVEIKVGKDGKVSNPKFISGPPIFKDAAFDAVLKYQFKPAKLNGQPIEQTTQIKLVFKE